MATRRCQVLILGSGAAGCTAAIYASRANASTHVVRGLQPGGQMTITTDVENYPGFEDIVQGPWLMERMEAQARRAGAIMHDDVIVEADLDRRPFRCVGDSGDVYEGETLIIATGASARWLGLESETRYRGFGVSACATCDGFFFRGKRVAVIGGGATAIEEALFLTRFAARVYLIHRRDALRGEATMRDRLTAHERIEIRWNRMVGEILGEDDPVPHVVGVRLDDVKGGASEILDVDGVFTAIGHEPNVALFRDRLRCDDAGYIVTVRPGCVITDIPGVFAAGDVQDRVYRQAITAAGSGCMAGLEAARFLENHSRGGKG